MCLLDIEKNVTQNQGWKTASKKTSFKGF